MTVIARLMIYLIFFLSGAAALVYQVLWVRSLSLVFGGTHLAVTVVLSTFMAGLAAGGHWIGRYADRLARPLRFYGILELGIALSATFVALLVRLYPSIYVPLAQGRDDSPFFLALIRVLFSVLALIVPTTLMGGTLPVLARFVAGRPDQLRKALSFLYGFNTLGAVAGAVAAGFFLLRLTSVTTTLFLAVATNTVIGVAAMLLPDRAAERSGTPDAAAGNDMPRPASPGGPHAAADENGDASAKLVLWGIGVSGFCALGYEVLWSRVLTIVIGATVYGFTTMLAAFLTGIALGSKAYGLAPRKGAQGRREDRPLLWFGMVQVLIGLAALLTTLLLRDLPMVSARIQEHFSGGGMGYFGEKLWSGLVLAFLFMLAPAFLMGLAFPLAGTVYARPGRPPGGAVGDVLAVNTVGAILGAAASGFAAIYLFGIERSLQMLTIINIGAGLALIAHRLRGRAGAAAAAAATAAVLAFLALNPGAFRIWDTRYFAVFRNNQPEAFRTPERVRDAVENTEVLYYGEGVESIVSSIKVRGGDQAFITNGRIEASSQLQGQQHLYVLGHLPMLLHKDPRSVLVIGTGSGMTLGAVSAHPPVEKIILAEIEPKVLHIARTFGEYNHHVLDDPKLRIVLNDGRNYLMTTKERFDVITADPIHPWFRGAGYLYTTEYFRLAAARLKPGGILCQWLPLYELSTADLRSIVRTFTGHFPHTMLWLTHYDAEIIGSGSPIVIDERDLERRIAVPAVGRDLKRVLMGSAGELLSYFVMGTEGMKTFGRGGVLNTDDNLFLEFSAPFSMGNTAVMKENVLALLALRGNVLPFLRPAPDRVSRAAQLRRWGAAQAPAELAGRALALFLGGETADPGFLSAMEELRTRYPQFAPGRALRESYEANLRRDPVLLGRSAYPVRRAGARDVLELSAVLVPATRERSSVMFVDNEAKVVYGELYVPASGQDEFIRHFLEDVMTAVNEAYRTAAAESLRRTQGPPPSDEVQHLIRETVSRKVRERQGR